MLKRVGAHTHTIPDHVILIIKAFLGMRAENASETRSDDGRTFASLVSNAESLTDDVQYVQMGTFFNQREHATNLILCIFSLERQVRANAAHGTERGSR